MFGGPLTEWRHKSCRAVFGVGNDWATLYEIHSREESKGHATELLRAAKLFYERQGKRFGSTVALNDRMQSILQRLDIKEYTGNEDY